MARFKISEAEKFGGQGGAGFFSIKNVGESKRIRFMYNSSDEVEAYAVHEVKVNGKKRAVDCLRNADDSLDVCPFCKNKMYPQVRVYIPVYDVEEDRMKIWERGKSYIPKLRKIFEENALDKPLLSTVFDVTKVLDDNQLVKYEVEPSYSGTLTMEDFEVDFSPVYGNLVLVKTEDEMEKYLEAGCF